MSYRVVETGYKVVKFGKRVASCPMSCLSNGRVFLNGGVTAVALLGLSVATTDAASAQSINGALSAGQAVEFDGKLGAGYLITGDSRFSGSNANVTIGSTNEQSLIHNYDTKGGAGSGGGAGLGGVFFIDSGATLTVINTDFISNRVEGGQGGSEPALRFYDKTTNVTGNSVDLPSLRITADLTSLSFNTSTSAFEFDTVSVSSDVVGMLKTDSDVFFEGYDEGARIGRVASSTVQFENNVAIDLNDTSSFGTNDVSVTGDEVAIKYTITPGPLDSSGNPTATVTGPGDLSGITIGSKFVAGTTADRVLKIATVKELQFYTAAEDTALNAAGELQGKVKSYTIDSAVSNSIPYQTFAFFDAPTFDAAQFNVTGTNTVNVTSSLGNFSEGMTVTYDDNGVEKNATIVSVSDDGRSFTLDETTTLPADFRSFKAVENPILDDNKVRVTNAASQFSVGQRVYVPDANGVAFEGTVSSVTGDTLTVTPTTSGKKLSDFYDPAIGLALQSSSAEVVNDGGALKVTYDTSLQSGETASQRDARIVELLQGRVVEGASFAPDTTVSSVSVNSANGTVTLGLSESIGASDKVEYFKLFSALSFGGSMNNLVAPSNSSSGDGEEGVSANWLSTFFAEGEGVEGTNGAPAGDASAGLGFNGGDGGHGSDGQPTNFWLNYDLASAIAGVTTGTLDLIIASMDLAGAISPDPVIGAAVGVPDPVEIAKASFGISKSIIDMGFAVADLTLASINFDYWQSQLGEGLVGLGGEGGGGGEASGGADFFGGGTGGAGGDGGDGALSHIDGGDGGEGGRGGDGGFGAGGGQGGAGGEAGANGYAAGGDPGDGGFAGFGAGEGANGNGMFGGGGSGLGGAIFVREGGSLVIKGNSLFELNYVAGGTTTSEFGEAGMAAGSDLFMMKGANVRLEPGQGKQIRFEGDIADDSLATNDGFMNADGDGADITIAGNGGLVTFNGENTYSGDTILEGASLTAEMGVGVSDSSLLRFNGAGLSTLTSTSTSGLALGTVGTFLLQDDYVRRVGTDPFETAWTGSGGFASSNDGGITIVNLGQLNAVTELGQTLTWGADGFFVASSTTGAGINGTLTFGSELSTGAIRFTNDVDLNAFNAVNSGTIGRVAVFNTGTSASSKATLSGDWTNGGLLVGDAASGSNYDGTLFMTGANDLTTLILADGRLSTYNEDGAAGELMSDTSDIIVSANSYLDTFGSEKTTNAHVRPDGNWSVFGATEATGNVINEGTLSLLGAGSTLPELFGAGTTASIFDWLDDTQDLNYVSGDFADLDGTLKVGGNFSTTVGSVTNQFGSIEVIGTVTNAGLFSGVSALAVNGDVINTHLFDHGHELGSTITVGQSVENHAGWNSNGTLTIQNNLTNKGVMAVAGSVSVAGNAANTSAGRIIQSADVTVVGNVVNEGDWNAQVDSSITAKTLSGGGTFLLSSLVEQEIETDGGPQVTLVAGEARELALSLSDNSVFAGVFDGKGDLVKSGTGTLELSAVQTFDGALTVEAGGVIANATMSDELDIVVNLGAFYTAKATDTVNSVWNDGTFTLGDGANFITRQGFRNGSPNTLVMAADVTTLNGTFQNDGRTVVSGERVLTIGAADDVATGLTGSVDGDFEIAVGNGLTIIQDGDTTYSGEISRLGETSGYFAKSGDGVLTVSGSMSVLDIRIEKGSLALDGAYIVDKNAGIAISEAAALILVSGNQSIDSLSGEGFVQLGGNNLDIREGGAFSGTIDGKGIVNVQTGDFEIGGTLTSSSDESEFVVQAASTTRVGSSGTLDVEVLSVDGILELGGGDAKVVAETATFTGTLRGSGTINARTTIAAGGNLKPGRSPGMLSFAALTLGDGSTTSLDIDIAGSKAVAGNDYDRLNIGAGGKFMIDEGAILVLVENDASYLGETTQLLSFDELAVTGYFKKASTNTATGGVMNLATGNLVGLGGRTLSQLEALSTTENERAIYDGLRVNDEGGVGQFYGGRFVENLTAAWDEDGDTSAVFDKASPEVYAGLSASAEAAVMNSASDWVGGFVGKDGVTGSFFDASRSQYSADDSGLEYKSFGVQSTNTNFGLNVSSSDLTFLFSLGIASTKLESDYLNGTGDGLVMGAGFVGEIANSTETVWTAGLRQAILSIDGQRVANNDLVSFSNVDASATQFNLGVEHNGSNGQVDYGLRGNLELGSSKSNAFSETAGLTNTLDAMAVDGVKNRYARFNLGTKLASEITDGTSVVGSFDLSAPLSSSLVGVGASYDDGQGKFGVNSRGLDGVSFAATIGVDHETSEQGMISARIGAENTWNGDTALSASFSARVNF
jgi:fibronectin-binding autotransporter adhesin